MYVLSVPYSELFCFLMEASKNADCADERSTDVVEVGHTSIDFQVSVVVSCVRNMFNERRKASKVKVAYFQGL